MCIGDGGGSGDSDFVLALPCGNYEVRVDDDDIATGFSLLPPKSTVRAVRT